MAWLRIGRAAVSLLLIGCLAACNYGEYHRKSSGYDYGSRGRGDPRLLRARSFGSYSSDPRQHDNRYFEYSRVLSRRISALPGVSSAFVFVTDRNAYVGLMTDWSAAGTQARGGKSRMEQENTGTMEGVYNVDTGSPNWDNRHVATPYNSYFTHKDPVDISSKLRQTIGDEIRRLHPRVSEVHISGNREYLNQLVEFAKASWAGQSLGELTPEFNKLVSYMFGTGKEIPLPLYEHPAGHSSGGAEPGLTRGSK